MARAITSATVTAYCSSRPAAPTPACRPTPSASANTPSGASSKTQWTITTIASAMAREEVPQHHALRRAAAVVAAKPNRIANTTSAMIALSAAAATMLGGRICRIHWAQSSAGTTCEASLPTPARNASAVARSTGQAASRACDSATASTPASSSSPANQPMARVARRPVAMASATLATAETSIAKTSGPTVMRSALSQSVPTASSALEAV